MAKTYNDKDYFGKQKYLTDQAERYGINLGDYEVNGNNSGREFGPDLKSMRDLEKEVARNMSMDYDVREAIAGGQGAGNKRFEGLGDGISDISEAFAATQAMKKYHKNKLGNTGNFSSANDYSNVSGSLQRNYMEEIQQGINNNPADDTKPDDGTEEDPSMSWNDAVESGVLSTGVQEAIERAQNYKEAQVDAPGMMFNSSGGVNSTREETGATASDRAASSYGGNLDNEMFKRDFAEDIRGRVHENIRNKNT